VADIGGFQLSDKTSTQTDNATGGLAKGGELGDRQRCWETQRDPGEDKVPWGWGIPMLFLEFFGVFLGIIKKLI